MVDVTKSPYFTNLVLGLQSDINTVATSFIKFETEDNGTLGYQNNKATFEPLTDDRSARVGTVTLNNAKADGLKTVMQQDNLQALIASALCAKMQLPPSTRPLYNQVGYYAGTNINLTAMTTTVLTFTGASGLTSRFASGNIIQLMNFGNSANNIKTRIASLTSTAITLVDTLTEAESTVSSTAYIEKVGQRFDSAALDIAVVGTKVRLKYASTATNGNFDAMGLEIGEWVFIGGDDSGTAFSNNVGWARVSAITTLYLEFDKVSWASPVNETGTGKTIELYYGRKIKNRKGEANIIKWAWSIGMTLGSDADGLMTQVVKGAVLNTLKVSCPKPADNSKVSVDLSFLPTSVSAYSGAEAGGTVPTAIIGASNAIKDQMYTTSADMKRLKFYKRTTSASPSSFVANCSDMEVNINNNLEGIAALTSNSFVDVAIGMLEVSGKITCYFDDIKQIKEVIADSKFGLYGMWGRNFDGRNTGFVVDMPYLDIKSDGVTPKAGDKATTVSYDYTAVRDEDLNEVIFFGFYQSLPAIAIA